MEFSWHKCIPKVTEPSIYCPILNADLTPGSFITFSEDATKPDVKIGLIIRREKDSSLMYVNILQRLEDADLRVPSITDCTMHNIVELVQTQEFCTISTDLVTNIAFVFTFEQFKEDKSTFECQGTLNMFIIRYRSDGEAVEESKLKPFPSRHHNYPRPDCFAYRQFLFADRLRTAMSKSLGRYAAGQGDFVPHRIEVPIMPENWRFLLHCMQIDPRYLKDQTRKKSKRVLEDGMYLTAVRLSFDCTYFRLETVEEMKLLTEFLGEMCLVEVRKRRPAVDSP
jgi:hypothetical protein